MRTATVAFSLDDQIFRADSPIPFDPSANNISTTRSPMLGVDLSQLLLTEIDRGSGPKSNPTPQQLGHRTPVPNNNNKFRSTSSIPSTPAFTGVPYPNHASYSAHDMPMSNEWVKFLESNSMTFTPIMLYIFFIAFSNSPACLLIFFVHLPYFTLDCCTKLS